MYAFKKVEQRPLVDMPTKHLLLIIIKTLEAIIDHLEDRDRGR